MRRSIVPALILACVTLLSTTLWAPAASAAPLGWQVVREPAAGAMTLTDVTYAEGLFVVVGFGGTIATSPDGVTWTDRPSGTTEGLSAVTYGAGQFVAVGDRGTILTSPDGMTWNASDSPISFYLSDVVYGNGRFLAVGLDRLLSSLDGTHWTLDEVRTNRMGQVAFGEGRFVRYTASAILSSVDGLKWEGLDYIKFANLQILPRGVAYGGGQFLMVGSRQEETVILASPDGITWSVLSSWLSWDTPRFLAYGAGRWVVLGENSLLLSTDGIRWVPGPQLPFARGSWRGVAYGGGRFAAVGSDGATVVSDRLDGRAACGDLFPDVPAGSPACLAVEQLAQRKIINGYPDGRFHPDQPVTRAEFIKLVVAATGWQPEPEGALPFSDVTGHWAAGMGYLRAAYRRNVINGYPDLTFRPDSQVTRAEMVKMGAAALGVDPYGAVVYRDVRSTQWDWYAGWTAGAARDGLIHQRSANRLFSEPDFLGTRPATRAEAALLIANMLAAKIR